MTALPSVAIACQGGGSHAAFAAGVLSTLLAPAYRDRFRLVGLSGTSGGALCAALTWSGLIAGDADEAGRRLSAFWDDVAARDLVDAAWNAWALALARLPVTQEISPYAYQPAAAATLLQLMQRHIRLDALPPGRPGPELLVGATEVLTGERAVFRGQTLCYQALLASCAIPPLFRAVVFGGHTYWDGLFTSNPPIRELMELAPDELWIVQINPQRRDVEPQSVRDIEDRRNELSGNLSLGLELYFIDKVNALCAAHPTVAACYRHVTIRVVELDLPGLDAPSKFDRSVALIEALLAHGRARAPLFFEQESIWPRPDSIPGQAVRRN